ncbi:MAG TPA: DUF4912 domain-containing protein [Chthoniobacterales bacterium]
MAKQDLDKTAGAYRISEGPVTSALPSHRREDPASEHMLPAHYGMPLLLAIARDPRTLFVCWSVDWTEAFSKGLPRDRRAHVRVRSDGTEKIVGVEPTVGSCAIDELEPGATYSVELGYYGTADLWNSIVTGNEVMMPFESESTDEAIDVVTVPFHLTFQRMLNVLRHSNGGDLTQALARIQERAAAEYSELSPEEREMLRALNISADDLRNRAAYQASLSSSEKIRDRSEKLFGFGGTSPGQGFAGSSWGA